MKIKALLLISVVFIASGCNTKRYGLRQHRNHVAQQILQFEHSKPYRWGDWKACQHFAERPKSHWPFND